MSEHPTTVPCRICGKQTRMHGTRLCDRCWELEKRIMEDPEIARKILTGLEISSSESKGSKENAMMDEQLKVLIESAELTGKMDLLAELKDWLDVRLEEAREKHEQLKEQEATCQS